MKTVAFFNNKGGVGKTTLAYHVAHMSGILGHRVLLVDLDPQSNLTAMCLSESRLEALWPDSPEHPDTVQGCVRPLLRGIGDVTPPHVEDLDEGIALVPGDLGLSRFEDRLSETWPKALDRDEAAYRALSAFYRICRAAGEQHHAHVIFIDVGPNLGAINRSALIASDHVITPLSPDLYSMQGLRNLGPTLADWRAGWMDRLARKPAMELELPAGSMEPLGYIVMQTGMRLNRPVKAYQRWVQRMPGEFHRSVRSQATPSESTDTDPWCLGIMRHYQSLMPLAQNVQKPMFALKPADGAIGSHLSAVRRCQKDFERLAEIILERAGVLAGPSGSPGPRMD